MKNVKVYHHLPLGTGVRETTVPVPDKVAAHMGACMASGFSYHISVSLASTSQIRIHDDENGVYLAQSEVFAGMSGDMQSLKTLAELDKAYTFILLNDLARMAHRRGLYEAFKDDLQEELHADMPDEVREAVETMRKAGMEVHVINLDEL